VVSGRAIYSIGAVGQMLGIPPATLRTWEERYGLPVPERSPGGHRLYSRDQVEQLRFVERTGARRVLVDSLGDLAFAAGDESRYREHLYSLVQRCSRQGVSLLMTFELPELFQVTRLSEMGVSHVSDNVVLLQYLRQPDAMRRTLTVIKTRASLHQPQVREFTITPRGSRSGLRSPPTPSHRPSPHRPEPQPPCARQAERAGSPGRVLGTQCSAARRARPAGEYGGVAMRLRPGRARPVGWSGPGNQAKAVTPRERPDTPPARGDRHPARLRPRQGPHLHLLAEARRLLSVYSPDLRLGLPGLPHLRAAVLRPR
jgi:hypothetical protein